MTTPIFHTCSNHKQCCLLFKKWFAVKKQTTQLYMTLYHKLSIINQVPQQDFLLEAPSLSVNCRDDFSLMFAGWLASRGRQYENMYSNTFETLCPVFADVSKYGSPCSLERSMPLFISLANSTASSTDISLWSLLTKSCFVPTTTFRQSSFACSSRGRNLAHKDS